MKRIPIFLVLTLIAAWGYTSWYWYTCNIKWACAQQIQETKVSIVDEEEIEVTQDVVNQREVEVLSNSGQEVQSVTRSDVLVWDAFIPQAPLAQEPEEPTQNWETSSWDTVNQVDDIGEWSLSSEDSAETATGSTLNSNEDQDNAERVAVWVTDLCVSPLVGPISLWWANSSSEVVKLETFLIANAYLWNSDGVYGDADFQAVKQLQLDYKAQMLDPWGIDAPTWFVGRTTVATINSIWCKN